MGTNYQKRFEKDYAALYEVNKKIAEENRKLKYENQLLEKQLETAARVKAFMEAELIKQKKCMMELVKENERLKARINIDGTNSGIPTSQTPLEKKKVIPNSRTVSGRKVGGQWGHEKAKLKRFEDSAVTEEKQHQLKTCPHCQGEALEAIDEIIKDELDYKVVVTKVRHHFTVYRCACCGKETHEKIPKHLKEENQYGAQVQALALGLMNEGNVPIGKTKAMIAGLTNGAIAPSEGYIAKLQTRASKQLEPFVNAVKSGILETDLVHWDDTVIMVNTKSACLRFYGTGCLALYTAHAHKDKAGLDDDGILQWLPETTTVIHDHNKVNYNKDYSFQDGECNVHLLRDLAGVTANLGHGWAEALATLLTQGNEERKTLIQAGVTAFPEEILQEKLACFDAIMLRALAENRGDEQRYYASTERTLIVRLLDYKNEYLAWMVNFDIPFSNNLAERSLRGVKSKMKAAGQFQNIDRAKDYANIKTYLETCARNGLNGFYCLLMLCAGYPFTLADVLSKSPLRGNERPDMALPIPVIGQPDKPNHRPNEIAKGGCA